MALDQDSNTWAGVMWGKKQLEWSNSHFCQGIVTASPSVCGEPDLNLAGMRLLSLQPTKWSGDLPLPCVVGDSESDAGQQTWRDVWEDLVPGVCLRMCDS